MRNASQRRVLDVDLHAIPYLKLVLAPPETRPSQKQGIH